MAFLAGTYTLAEGRIPALEEDSLYTSDAEDRVDTNPRFYVWASMASGVMYSSVRSDIGGWMVAELSLSAATQKGWLLSLQFPRVGFPPPLVMGGRDYRTQVDSLLGYSILIGKRLRWKHGHLSFATGLHHAHGVRIYSSETCGMYFETDCAQIIERKYRFSEYGPLIQLDALAGWPYFGFGFGLEALGSRHQTWGWHIQIVAGRVF